MTEHKKPLNKYFYQNKIKKEGDYTDKNKL